MKVKATVLVYDAIGKAQKANLVVETEEGGSSHHAKVRLLYGTTDIIVSADDLETAIEVCRRGD